MSFSLWPWFAEGGLARRFPAQGFEQLGRGMWIRNPRAARRSGCAPAEPYPPNRTYKLTLPVCLAKWSIRIGTFIRVRYPDARHEII
jgi:hypothetical protein